MSFLFSLFLLWPSLGQAAPPLSCVAVRGNLSATFTFESTKFVSLAVREGGGAASLHCELAEIFTQDRRRGLLPGFSLIFRPKDCVAGAKPISEKLHQRISVAVEVRGERPARATLQWLESHQPDACEIKHFDADKLGKMIDRP